jgi:glutathione synthase/RimK-type ligase-like ATP-grasp enzyme
MKFQIYAYKDYSKGAKALSKELGFKFQKKTKLLETLLEDSTSVKPILINWGAGSISPEITTRVSRIINPPKLTNICSDKVEFFDKQAAANNVRIPVYTKDQTEALDWVNNGITVMGRKARGSCGTDIHFFEDDPEGFANSDFWAQYKKKKDEFRVHVVGGNVIAVQRKALRDVDPVSGEKIDRSTVDFRIRNHRNGFIFQRNDITVPDDVTTQALTAVKNIGLDFGAVDVIFNEKEGKAYVLEINTAPGLEGTTVTDYAKALTALVA